MNRPLLLIDVDGVISLYGFDPSHPPPGRFQLVDGITHFLSATAGEHLCRLADDFELAWCTGWEEKANEYLPAVLGLPGPLPHLTLDPLIRPPSAHWKLSGIDGYADPMRPLAWIDDAHDDRCTAWATTRRAPTLLVTTDPAVGITGDHVEQLISWARNVSADRL
jgi:hypothetical protein